VSGGPDGRQSPPYMVQLKDLTAERVKHGDVEAYSSIYRYPTSDPYSGPVLSGWYMDFDCAENPGRAQKECAAVVSRLVNEFRIPEEMIGIAFSGGKGFHMVLNRRVFNAQPSEDLPKVWRSMMEEMVHVCKLKTVDSVIYHRRALWRLPNSKHRSGYYKIHITKSELDNTPIEKIRELATKPRLTLAIVPSHVPEAERWYLKHVSEIKKRVSEWKEKLDAADLSVLKADLPCVQKLFGSGAPLGRRNIARYVLGVSFRTAGKSLEECQRLLVEFNSRCDPPESEANVVNDVTRLYTSEYHVGCGDFEEYCPGKEACPLFTEKGVGKENVVTEQAATMFSEAVKAEAERCLMEDPIVYVAKVGGLLHKGDEELLKLDWLSALSPELSQQIHLMSVGKSGKGKSHHCEVSLEFIPIEYVIYVMEPSPKSFFYAAKAGIKFDKRVLLIDDARQAHIPILKALTSQNRRKPRAWSVDEQEFIDMNIEGNMAVWCSSVSPIRDQEGQLTRRFLIVNPSEDEALDKQVAEFAIARIRRGFGVGDVPPEFEVVKCMTATLKEQTCRVVIPFEFNFPTDPQRTLHNFFLSILQAAAKANMRKRLTVDREGERILWAQPEDFEEAKKIWIGFAVYQKGKVDATSLRILDVLPEAEPQGSMDEHGKEMRPEPCDTAPTVTYLSRRLKEAPSTVRDKLENLYDAGLIDHKWFGSWNTQHFYWKMPFLAMLDEETKIRPESLTLDSLGSFAVSVGLDTRYAEEYLRRLN